METSHLIRKIKNVRFCFLSDYLFLDYDKLSSIDIFDFDGYVNLFEGENKSFIQKLVHTQSFNNFIEETYKN
jgi:hypothetical protein